MTDAQWIDRVVARLTHLGQESSGLFAPDADLQLAAARKQLAIAVMRSPDADLLRKSFNITITAQVADLAPSLNAAEPMLFDSGIPPFISVQVAGVECDYVNGWANLAIKPVSDGQTYYSLQDSKLKFKKAATVTGTTDVLASYVPLTANWQEQFEPALEQTLIGIVRP